MIKSFKKWLQKQNISTNILIDIVKEIQDGLVDADLGNFYIKNASLFTVKAKEVEQEQL